MINDIREEANASMLKRREALETAFKKIRTGRAHPSILDAVMVNYYGAPTPLNQLANINVEDGRTLTVMPWEKPLMTEIEKAIMKSDLGLNPANNGDIIRVPMPALTEETRKNYIRQAREEAEKARIAVRNVRRDANSHIKELLKDKDISEDEARKGEDNIQQVTNQHIEAVDKALALKEKDLMEV